MAFRAIVGNSRIPMDIGKAVACARSGKFVRRTAWRRGEMVFFADAEIAAAAGMAHRAGTGRSPRFLAKCGPDGFAAAYSPTKADRNARDWALA